MQTRKIQIQWGSEIRTRLDFEWSKRGWVANGRDFEWDLKSGQMGAIFFKTIWNPDKIVQISNGPVFEWLGLYIAITKAHSFENRTIVNPTFKKSRFQMVRFQIPTVLDYNGHLKDDCFTWFYQRLQFGPGETFPEAEHTCLKNPNLFLKNEFYRCRYRGEPNFGQPTWNI